MLLQTYNLLVEIAEARNGVFVDRYSLNDNSGGHGKWRGGKGVCIEYRMRSDNAWLTFSYTRSKFPPWGLAGGQEGTPNYIVIARKDGTEERLSAATELRLATDDVIRIHTGNGAVRTNARFDFYHTSAFNNPSASRATEIPTTDLARWSWPIYATDTSVSRTRRACTVRKSLKTWPTQNPCERLRRLWQREGGSAARMWLAVLRRWWCCCGLWLCCEGNAAKPTYLCRLRSTAPGLRCRQTCTHSPPTGTGTSLQLPPSLRARSKDQFSCLFSCLPQRSSLSEMARRSSGGSGSRTWR